jgi:hypothetical protein
MKFGFTLSVAFTTLLLTNAAQANAQETWNTCLASSPCEPSKAST